MPYAFTEQGVSMLSGVLNSETAIQVHIQIIRVFAKMRELLVTHKEILLQLEKMEKKLAGHDEDIKIIFIATTLSFFLQFLIINYFTKVSLAIRAFDWGIVKRHIIAGFPLGLTSILGVLYYMVDSFIVSAMLSPEDYAILKTGNHYM